MEGEPVNKPHTVTISWLKQRSGNYALKGIKITEGDRAYDSSTAFREEDAAGLTSMLGANPDVEVSAPGSSTVPRDSAPEWTRAVAANQQGTERVAPLELERASSTVLRYFLASLIDACSPHAVAKLDPGAVAKSAARVLRNTDTGTHYTLAEVNAILNGHRPKAPTAKPRK